MSSDKGEYRQMQATKSETQDQKFFSRKILIGRDAGGKISEGCFQSWITRVRNATRLSLIASDFYRRNGSGRMGEGVGYCNWMKIQAEVNAGVNAFVKPRAQHWSARGVRSLRDERVAVLERSSGSRIERPTCVLSLRITVTIAPFHEIIAWRNFPPPRRTRALGSITAFMKRHFWNDPSGQERERWKDKPETRGEIQEGNSCLDSFQDSRGETFSLETFGIFWEPWDSAIFELSLGFQQFGFSSLQFLDSQFLDSALSRYRNLMVLKSMNLVDILIQIEFKILGIWNFRFRGGLCNFLFLGSL